MQEDLLQNVQAAISEQKLRKFNLKSFLVAGLRRMSYRHPARSEALKRARVSRGIYRCEMCNELFKKQDVIVDHKQPIVAIKDGFTTWDSFIEKLFCEPEGLQILCKDICNRLKTDTENKLRKIYRQKRNKKIDNSK